MTDTPQKRIEAPAPEVILGIAKKFTLELEKFPLHSHAAIARMVMTMVEHRKIVLEEEVQLSQQAANEAAMADAIDKHGRAIAQQRALEEAAQQAHDRQIADGIKAPRMKLELVDGKAVPEGSGTTEPLAERALMDEVEV